jgi:hypothetical protein
MNAVMMKCGHAANATWEGKPVCAIHMGIDPGATETVDPPDLSGREMVCVYARGRGGPRHRPIPSDSRAAYFAHKPLKEYDEFYDGCFGWD